MQKNVILISAVSGDIGSAAVRSLDKAGYKIIGCDMKPHSPVSNRVDKYHIAPPAHDTQIYMKFLNEVILKENINFFLPISEPEMEVLNLRRDEIETSGAKLLLNNKTILDNFLDKLKTVKYLRDMGIEVPGTMPLSVYDGSFGYPLIVKARKGCGSKRFWKIETPIDLDYIKQKDDGFLIAQEDIGGDDEDYTTGVFSDGSAVSSITFRRKLGYGSLTIEAMLADEPFLDNLSRQIGEKTQLKGSINIQSRKVGNIFIPYEINPRLSSTLLFRKKFGFDDAIWWLNILQGKGYSYSKKYKSGIAVRCLSECYFNMEKIQKNDD
jgi:carbamoyl-phosphate synthase large subunit